MSQIIGRGCDSWYIDVVYPCEKFSAIFCLKIASLMLFSFFLVSWLVTCETFLISSMDFHLLWPRVFSKGGAKCSPMMWPWHSAHLVVGCMYAPSFWGWLDLCDCLIQQRIVDVMLADFQGEVITKAHSFRTLALRADPLQLEKPKYVLSYRGVHR